MASNDRIDDGRSESANERYDRNWNELLQELRVTQAGTQIISGFLLTLAFQPRFEDLDTYQVTVYVILILLAACSTALGLTPVGLHRALFGRHQKFRVVRLTNTLVQLTVIVVAMLTTGVVLFVLDIVIGRTAGIAAGTVMLVFLVVLLFAMPRFGGHRV